MLASTIFSNFDRLSEAVNNHVTNEDERCELIMLVAGLEERVEELLDKEISLHLIQGILEIN